MTPTFNRALDRGINWRRELPPILVVAGLAADYLSPPAPWTMLLPFGFILVLLALRKWVHAAAVFLLCSWVLVPIAARTLVSFEEDRGDHVLYVAEGATLPAADDELVDPRVLRRVRFQELPVGPGHVINPRWVLRDVMATFVDVHNAMVVEHLDEESTAGSCRGFER
jgi:hypothetical protein